MAKIRNFEEARKNIKNQRTGKNNMLMIAIILAVLVGLTILILFQTTSLPEMIRADNEARKQAAGFPVAFEDDQQLGIYSSEGKIVILTETHIFVYDSQGRLYLSVLHGLSSPVCEVVGTNILYYSRQGKTAKVVSFYGEPIASYTVAGEIQSADFSKSGYLAIAYKSEKGVSRVDVYYGRQMMEWKDSDSFVSMVKFSNDNQSVFICTYNADSSGKFVSTIKEYMKLNSEPRNTWTLTGVLALDIEYVGSSPIVIGDEKALSLNADGKTTEYSYGGKTLINYHFYRHGLALQFNQFTSFEAQQICLLNSNLEEITKYETESQITASYLENSTFYILSENTLRWYNQDGEEIAFINAPEDVLGMVILGREAYFMTADYLYCSPLNGNEAMVRSEVSSTGSYVSIEITNDDSSEEVISEEESASSVGDVSKEMETSSETPPESVEEASSANTLGGNPSSG